MFRELLLKNIKLAIEDSEQNRIVDSVDITL